MSTALGYVAAVNIVIWAGIFGYLMYLDRRVRAAEARSGGGDTKMKRAYWAGAILILGFLALGLSTFTKSMTPYVTFAEAKSSHRTVQVMGALEKGSTKYDMDKKVLYFTLVDPQTKEVIPVSYTDVKPANFEDAVSIVAIGRYENEKFSAEKLLVKCPSKYQGEEIEKQYGKKA